MAVIVGERVACRAVFGTGVSAEISPRYRDARCAMGGRLWAHPAIDGIFRDADRGMIGR